MPLNVPREMFIYFGVPWNWLSLASEWIPVDVVPGAVAQQTATVSLQLTQEVAAFHTAISLIA